MDKDEIRWRPPILLLIPLFLCVVFMFYVNVFQAKIFEISTFQVPRPRILVQVEEINVDGEFLIKTEGCRIPYLDPFDSSITQFIFDEDKVVCNNNKPPLVESNLTHIFLVKESLPAYEITNVDALKCCFSSFKRVVPRLHESDNKISLTRCVKFKKTIKIKTQFVRINCTYNGEKIYTDFFSFVPTLKSKVRLPQVKRPFLNVLIVGLDAVSRVNLHRQMPKTVQVLKEIQAVEFLGFNKIGDNTFPNVIPILTGLHENELVQDCWPRVIDRFDNCSFIWKQFSANGYLTAFGEDAAWMGMFNYGKFGFRKQPTDYFWDPFNYQAEKQIGNQHRMNVDQCIGSREVYTVLLDYITRLATTMNMYNKPYFGFFWGSSLSHDFLNKPKLGDANYAQFIKGLSANEFLEDTVLFFISDHGIRWGEIRATYQGRMEERLPFLFVALPERFRKTRYKLYNHLKSNAKRLITPFDLHNTLEDIVNLHSLNERVINTRIKNRKGNERAYSLFEPVPTSRNCASAGIEMHWCTCQNTTAVHRKSEIVIKVVKFSVNYINKKLKPYKQCAKLKLLEVLNARKHTSDSEFTQKDYNFTDYTVVFKTLPGHGIFEATVRTNFNKVTNDYYLNMAGTISRINLYGTQSVCVKDFHLKLYCYCV